jgi:hypothetical protein
MANAAPLPFEPLPIASSDRADKPQLYTQPEKSADLTADQIDDDALVRTTLRAICADPTAPASARAQSARTLAEMQQLLGRDAKPRVADTTPVREMSRAQLEALIAGN